MSVKNQLETGPPPCPAVGAGVGILAQNDTALALTLRVQNSTFTNAAQAIEADGPTYATTVTNNTFQGNLGTNANAISILHGSSTIQGNTISDYNYPPAGSNINGASFGIYLSCSPSGTVSGNSFGNTQVGLYLEPNCASNTVSITGNNIANANLIGIELSETNGLVQNNDIHTTQTAIRLAAVAASNVIQSNRIDDACAAFSSNPAAGSNTLLSNSVFNAINLALVNSTALCP